MDAHSAQIAFLVLLIGVTNFISGVAHINSSDFWQDFGQYAHVILAGVVTLVGLGAVLRTLFGLS
jgi:hypothetical protein